MSNSVWTEFGIEHAKKGEGRSTVALKDRRGLKTAALQPSGPIRDSIRDRD